MIVIAIIGVLAFVIVLITRAPQRKRAAVNGSNEPAPSPQWYEFTLALILLAAIAAFAIWLISSGTRWMWGETIEDWRSDARTISFAAVMVALAVIGLIVSLAYTLTQSALPLAPASRPLELATDVTPGAAAITPAASPLRVLGLLALVLAILLLCWIALPYAGQYGLVVQLIYPASLGVAFVLLLDKATRTWGAKGSAESLRAWLLCDLLVFLLVVAFLNLHNVAKPETYVASFWDILNVVLFLIAFWMIDRSVARSRFLVGYGYLVVLPLLLLIWQTIQGVSQAVSWWASIWPFLIAAGVFFVLEIATLVSSTSEQQVLPAVKDALFTVAYAVLLIVAVKS